MESSSIIKMPLFDGTNFSNWKYRVGILLDEKNLRKYIDEDLSNILTSVNAADRDKIKLEEKKCVSILVQTMQDSQLEYIKDKQYAKAMFDALNTIFERKSISSQLLLRKQLLSMKYHESESIVDYFLHFDTKIRELKSTGAKLEEIDIVVHLLLTLPKSYDGLVTALETMDQSKLNVDFVKSRLIDEFNKRKGVVGGKSSNESSAMNVKNSNIVCFRCGKKGHIKSKCFSKKNVSNSGNESSSGNVNKKSSKNDSASNGSRGGHSSLGAFIHKGDEKSTTNSGTFDDEMCFNSDAQRNMFKRVFNGETHIKFVLDSGASQHMVNSGKYFNILRNIDDVKINVAKKNQELIAKQQGDIEIKTFFENDCSVRTIKDVLLVKDLKCNLLSIKCLTQKECVCCKSKWAII